MERSMHVKFPVFCDYDVEVVIADDAKKARTRRNKTYGVYDKNFSALHGGHSRHSDTRLNKVRSAHSK